MLVFTDIHEDWDTLKKISEARVDVFISAGDLVEKKENVKHVLNMFKRRSLLIVPGNNERPEWYPLEVNIHGRKAGADGFIVGGIGGSPKTPFNTVFEWEEDYAYHVLESLGYVDILVSHAPPKDTDLSLTYSGIDAGSEAVRWYIEEFSPQLVVTGHIHERSGVIRKLRESILINPGKRGFIVNKDLSIEPYI